MRNIYSKIRSRNLFLTLCLSVLSAAPWVSVKAFPGGTYTIDPTQAASASNYLSFTAFTNDLRNINRGDGGANQYAVGGAGLQGAITVNVASGQTFTEQIQITQITGASSVNTITINGNGSTLQFNATSSSAKHTLWLNGTDYLTVDNLKILGTNATYAWVVRLNNNADWNTFKNCTIQATAANTTATYTGGTSANACIAFVSSSTSLSYTTSGITGSNNTFDNNLITGPNDGASLYGVTYGIFEHNNASAGYGKNKYTNNTVKNFYAFGIHGSHTNNNEYTNNTITRNLNAAYSTSWTGGIYLYYPYFNTNASTDYLIEDNIVTDFKGTSNITNFYGVYVNYPNGGSSTTNGSTMKVNRNTVSKFGPFTSTSYGMYVYYGYYGLQMNDNTVKNLTHTTSASVYGIYTYYCYYASIERNIVSDVSINNTSSYFYGQYHGYAQYAKIYDNEVKDISGVMYYWYGIYNYYCYYADIQRNVVKNVLNTYTTNTTMYMYVMDNYYCQYATIANNVMENIVCRNNYYLYVMYNYYCYYAKINDNKITKISNGVGYSYAYYTYLMYNYYCQYAEINRNYMHDIVHAYYYLYSMYNYYCYYSQINNNVMGNQRTLYYWYGMYNYYCRYSDIDYNTIHYYDPTSGSGGYPRYAMYNYYNDYRVTNNNISIYDRKSSNYPYYYFYYSGVVEKNNFHFDMTAPTYQMYVYACYGTSFPSCGTSTDFNGFNNNKYAQYRNDIVADPMFVDMPGGDYRFTNEALNAYATPIPGLNIDNTSSPRNLATPDVGAVEVPFDYAVTDGGYVGGANVCASYKENIKPTVKSNMSFNISSIKVGFKLNNNPVVTFDAGAFTSGQSKQVTIPKAVDFGGAWPNSVLKVFIVSADDNVVNDTQYYNINVTPSPNGSMPTHKAGSLGIFDLANVRDVTVANEKIEYNITAPSKYTESDYGTKWTATVFARTKNMVALPGSTVSWTHGNGSSTVGVLAFTPTEAFTDSVLQIGINIQDAITGCDSTFWRNLFVAPTGKPKVIMPTQICDGDEVFFENLSTVSSGGLVYEWDFGDGSPITNATSPVHTFPTSGTYMVKMTTITDPYFYRRDTIIAVTIKAVPQVDFDRVNACQGSSVNLTNTTTTPGTPAYEWNFGDGSPVVTSTNASKMYASVGGYKITLKATLNGCSVEKSKNAYVFAKPTASFTKSIGECSSDEFMFNSASSITNGSFGHMWDFNDNGAISSVANPAHKFSSAGNKAVKLIVTSEFGCTDSSILNIFIKEGPTANFSPSPACSVTPTTFTNTTIVPTGQLASYNWNFGDGTTSLAETPVKNWTALGPKTVTLDVTLSNGCKDKTEQVVNVLNQPTVSFSTDDVCAGEPAVFENNTTWASGDISYEWNFGDNNSSVVQAPTHVFNTSSTLTYTVTLVARIAGGCADSMSLPITINEKPKTCDFIIESNMTEGHRAYKMVPTDGTNNGNQSGVTYRWLYGDGSQDNAGKYNYLADGTYSITMIAISDNGCECKMTKTHAFNFVGLNDIQLSSRISVYPNPSNGIFTVNLEGNNGNNWSVEVYNMVGELVTSSSSADNNITLDLSNNAAGMYMVKVISNGNSAIAKINVVR